MLVVGLHSDLLLQDEEQVNNGSMDKYGTDLRTLRMAELIALGKRWTHAPVEMLTEEDS